MRYGFEIAVVCVITAMAALVLFAMQDESNTWAGSDTEAEEVIGEVTGGYEPWTRPLWEPPSGEIESLFFSLQAAAGALVIGFFFGYAVAKREKQG
ncbi:MAG: energy-coupling factor ABC transporter substrate-binding protein [Methanobacteriota archaeon]|nr:MAG: energy-coupling factor ABC transporter substrate-binding protein [Euryarchaeota archaeon]